MSGRKKRIKEELTKPIQCIHINRIVLTFLNQYRFVSVSQYRFKKLKTRLEDNYLGKSKILTETTHRQNFHGEILILAIAQWFCNKLNIMIEIVLMLGLYFLLMSISKTSQKRFKTKRRAASITRRAIGSRKHQVFFIYFRHVLSHMFDTTEKSINSLTMHAASP